MAVARGLVCMKFLDRRVEVPLRVEAAGAVVIGWLALIAIPLTLGHIGISWDAQNHHVYLGWTAQSHRFGHDQLAAAFQSFQSPYSYWPVYRLAVEGVSGALAGVVLATLHAVALPAVWLIAYACIRGRTWIDLILRLFAVVFGFSSPVVLSMFDSTSNDLLAAIPLLWSVALAATVIGRSQNEVSPHPAWIATSGLLAGTAVALKLSNGPVAVLMPVLWCLCGTEWSVRIRQLMLGSLAAVIGFALTYGYWGWQLWLHVGNPVYPFADAWFEPLRRWADWHP
jgi:hypothetical protein